MNCELMLELGMLLRPGKTNSYPAHDGKGEFWFELRISDRWGSAIPADTEDEAWERWYTGYEGRHNFPNFVQDLNDLAEVWRELKERGLFSKWVKTIFPKYHPYYSTSMIYNLLADPKGQVEAAVKVLREEKGGK